MCTSYILQEHILHEHILQEHILHEHILHEHILHEHILHGSHGICKLLHKLYRLIINLSQHGDRSTLRHLPVYNKRNNCIHIRVYLFV